MRTGPSRRSGARVATTSAGAAVFAAVRLPERDRHASSCQPLGLATWSHRKETQTWSSLVVAVVVAGVVVMAGVNVGVGVGVGVVVCGCGGCG